jgi:pyruvate formate lyase activating enzyme
MARRRGARGVAWTYNEPTIWYEYTYDASKLAKKEGLYTCYVTNGYIQEDPLREIAPYLDAMNVDVKAFNEEFYRKLCKAKLEPVLRTCEIAHSLGIHLELTYLIIPKWNDSPDEIRSPDIAIHFSRFHGNYRMRDHPTTPVETLDMAHRVAKEEGVKFVYLGNVPGSKYENTFCPRCGTLLIHRFGFTTTVHHRKCPRCRYVLPVVW